MPAPAPGPAGGCLLPPGGYGVDPLGESVIAGADRTGTSSRTSWLPSGARLARRDCNSERLHP